MLIDRTVQRSGCLQCQNLFQPHSHRVGTHWCTRIFFICSRLRTAHYASDIRLMCRHTFGSSEQTTQTNRLIWFGDGGTRTFMSTLQRSCMATTYLFRESSKPSLKTNRPNSSESAYSFEAHLFREPPPSPSPLSRPKPPRHL